MSHQLADVSPVWCVRLIAEFNAADERATTLAKTLTARELNWKPRLEEWSIGQCLEHLCVSSEVYLPPIADALAGRPLGVAQDITSGWLGRWFIRAYIEPSRETRRRRAPKKIAPATLADLTVLDRFLSNNRDAGELVERAKNYDVNKIRFRNPFVPGLRFTVGTGLEILSKHQSRHLLQAERIAASLQSAGRAPAI